MASLKELQPEEAEPSATPAAQPIKVRAGTKTIVKEAKGALDLIKATDPPITKSEPEPKPEPETDPRKLAGLSIVRADKPAEWLNILVYGEPGVGKTVLAGSASQVEAMSPVLLVDVEGGSLSLRDFYPNVDIVRVDSYQAARLLSGELREKKGAGYRTVIVDSLSELARLSMLDIMEDVVKANANRDKDIPSVKDWGKNIEQVRRLVRYYRDLPMNSIFTCHETEKEDESTKITKTRPSLSGKMAVEIAGFVDEVWYYYIKTMQVSGEVKVKRFLLTAPDGRKIAKDRSNKLPLVVENPSMARIYAAIYQDEPIPLPA